MLPMLSFRYLDNKVFVSLANGEVIVYQREAGERKLRMCVAGESLIQT